MNKETEKLLRDEVDSLQCHILELRRAIDRAYEALNEGRSYDAQGILEPYSDL